MEKSTTDLQINVWVEMSFFSDENYFRLWLQFKADGCRDRRGLRHRHLRRIRDI